MIIKPANKITGRITVPGDKSISHRAAMLAAIADGVTEITGFASSADCQSTLDCMKSVGVGISRSGANVRIEGQGLTGLSASQTDLDCGNSGSTMRMLAGILAGQKFNSTLVGDASLSSRPMGRIISPLEKMGAVLSSENGRAPLRVEGHFPLSAINYQLPVASAQVKSCVLLAGLFADGRTQVVEKLGLTRDHTERMLRWFGVDVQSSNFESDDSLVHSIQGGSKLTARPLSVPGDVSSAAFFIVGAALLPGSDLVIENVGLNATRAQVVSAARSVGVDISIEDQHDACNEPVGTLRIKGGSKLAGFSSPAVLEGSVIAQLIDELPVLSVLGTMIEGGLVIRNAAELRVKESDRIATTVANLRAMGAKVDEFEDGLQVHGPVKLQGARIETHGDHRIAMAFSIAALTAEGDTEIADAECASVSFPEFYSHLEKVAVR